MNPDIVFYVAIFPSIILIMIGVTTLVLMIWTIHQVGKKCGKGSGHNSFAIIIGICGNFIVCLSMSSIVCNLSSLGHTNYKIDSTMKSVFLTLNFHRRSCSCSNCKFMKFDINCDGFITS